MPAFNSALRVNSKIWIYLQINQFPEHWRRWWHTGWTPCWSQSNHGRRPRRHNMRNKHNCRNYRLCKVKAAQDDVLGKIDASLAKNTLTATEAPHLDTKASITKLGDVAKTVDFDVSTILANKWKTQFLAQSDQGYAKYPGPRQNYPKPNNRKDSSDIAKNSSDSWSRKKDNCCVLPNLPTNWRRKLTHLLTIVNFRSLFWTQTL